MAVHSIHIQVDDKDYKLLLEKKLYKSWKDFIIEMAKNL